MQVLFLLVTCNYTTPLTPMVYQPIFLVHYIDNNPCKCLRHVIHLENFVQSGRGGYLWRDEATEVRLPKGRSCGQYCVEWLGARGGWPERSLHQCEKYGVSQTIYDVVGLGPYLFCSSVVYDTRHCIAYAARLFRFSERAMFEINLASYEQCLYYSYYATKDRRRNEIGKMLQ